MALADGVESRGGQQGLPDFLGQFRRRYAFLIGLALSLLAVCVLSKFVLTIDVFHYGCYRLSTAAGGVRRDMRPPALDRACHRPAASPAGTGLSRMSINLYGTRLEVVVREAVESPEIVDDEGFYDVISEADGIITQVEPMVGEAAVQEGDTVARGEVLISGLISIQPPQYSDQPVRY